MNVLCGGTTLSVTGVNTVRSYSASSQNLLSTYSSHGVRVKIVYIYELRFVLLEPPHPAFRSRIHESKISLRFLGIILRVLRVEVSVYNVYVTNQFLTHFEQEGGGGVKSASRGNCE